MGRTARTLLGLIGALLLLPGVCSLGYMSVIALEWLEGYRNLDYIGIAMFLWIVSFALSAVGVLILRRVRRAPRA